jgi:UDP-3-O-[3-hydroxymyristoyl] glucosamine N-acyltransferase
MNNPSAFVHPDAKIGQNVVIEPFAYIDKDTEIGDGCWIGPNACIWEGSRIGDNCKIFAGAQISSVKIRPLESLSPSQEGPVIEKKPLLVNIIY